MTDIVCHFVTLVYLIKCCFLSFIFLILVDLNLTKARFDAKTYELHTHDVYLHKSYGVKVAGLINECFFEVVLMRVIFEHKYITSMRKISTFCFV